MTKVIMRTTKNMEKLFQI